jgi:aminoglycoside 6-adenylyltransferase
MRTEKEILDLILGTARQDDRIRAVVMNGSRVNPNAPQDPFQDYDIVYFVTDVAPFRRNFDWITRFGELMILQMPGDMGDPPGEADDHYAYLMQFTDGNRIDLSFCPVERVDEITRDSLSVLLLDKDGLIGLLKPPNDRDYLPKPPSAKQFADCCNEFWWVCPYVAKGLWRRELPYAKYMIEVVVREQLIKMLTWQIGVRSGFKASPGKFGKYLEKHLDPEQYRMLSATFAGSDYDELWQSLFTMGDLFRSAAKQVAVRSKFEYLQGDDDRVSAHLRHVKDLPRHATEMY